MWAEHSICISADDQLGQLKRHQSKLAGPIGVGLDTLKGVQYNNVTPEFIGKNIRLAP
jgi:hypothetical protein